MAGHSFIGNAIVLLILGCYFFLRGVMGVTNKYVKLYNALNHVNCIFIVFCLLLYLNDLYTFLDLYLII